MTSLQSLLLDLQQSILGALGSVIGYAVLFALLGLVLGIVLVIFAGRRRMFQRSFPVWTWIARINYVYIPVLLLGFGLLLGGIFGAQKATEGFIDRQSATLTGYSKEYVTNLQQFVRQKFGRSPGQQVSVEQMVAGLMSTTDIEPGSRLYRATYELNVVVVQQALKPLMRSSAQQDPLLALQNADLGKISERSLATVPQMLHLRSNMFYFAWYVWAAWLFGLLLLLPVLEMVAHWLYRRFAPNPAAPMQFQPATGPEPAYAPVAQPEQAMRTARVSTFVSMPIEPALPPDLYAPPPPVEVAAPVVEVMPEEPAVPWSVEAVSPPLEMETAPSFVALTPAVEPEAHPNPYFEEAPVPAEAAQQATESFAPPVDMPVEAVVPEPVTPPMVVVAPPPPAAVPPVVLREPAPPPIRNDFYAPAAGSGRAGIAGDKGAIQSITLILCGSLLQIIGSIGDSIAASLVAAFGFFLYFSGIGRLKDALDATGQRGAGMLQIGAIVGIIGAVLGMIPLLGGMIAGLFGLAAFTLELVGLLNLKNSGSFGPTAKSGFSLLLIGLGLALAGSIFSILPLVGGFIASFFFLVVLLLFLYGWLRVQEEFLHDPHVGRD